jgi:hypothetical protein
MLERLMRGYISQVERDCAAWNSDFLDTLSRSSGSRNPRWHRFAHAKMLIYAWAAQGIATAIVPR